MYEQTAFGQIMIRPWVWIWSGLLTPLLGFPLQSIAGQDQLLQELLQRTRQVQQSQSKLLEVLDARRSEIRERLATFEELLQEGLVARVKVEALRDEFEEVAARWAEESKRLRQSRQLEREIVTFGAATAEEASLVERSSGGRNWKLEELPALSKFYENRFGEALPISARGQTELHNQLGFDHHRAADLAIHPDSDAGKAILLYLRQQEIPFVAFRSAIEGSASGAHIHVGALSPRLSAR